MDDTISRRAAIDIVDGWFKRIELNADICLDGLRQLPSATDTNVGTKLGTDLAEVGTDCISRQVAIDALKKDMESLDHIIKGMSANDVRLDAYVSQRNQVNYDIYTINNLPTAQPLEDIHREKEQAYYCGYEDGKAAQWDWLKTEIKRMKMTYTICINPDYYTGYMSALSAVEGYIAQSEGDAE